MFRPSDFLQRNAVIHPERLALVASGKEMTYAELDCLASRLAYALKDKGLKTGDHIAYLLGNNCAAVILFQAILKLGAVAVPLNKRLNASDIAFMLDEISARALFFDLDMAKQVHEAIAISHPLDLCVYHSKQGFREKRRLTGTISWHDLMNSVSTREAKNEVPWPGHEREDSDALVLFTSGTTGNPKAVIRNAEQLSMLAISQLIEGHSMKWGVEVLYTQAPVYHMGGFLVMLKMCSMGGTLILESHFHPETIFSLIEKYDVTQMYMIPPALFYKMATSDARCGRTFPHVREAQCAGGRKREQDIAAVFGLFPNALLRVSFGSSETGMTCTTYFTKEECLENPTRALSLGTPNACVSLKLLGDNREPVQPGSPGRAWIKSPMNFDRYGNLPRATMGAFDSEGYFDTGDILKETSEGLFEFVDRACDMIKTGGENVYAREVELVVAAFPGIQECVAIAVPDDKYGEAIGIAIVTDGDCLQLDYEKLVSHCKKRMASFKKPRYALRVDEIPRNALGKIQKNELRARIDEFELIIQ